MGKWFRDWTFQNGIKSAFDANTGYLFAGDGGDGSGGGGGGSPMIELPPFFEDEFYKPSQDLLFGMGKDFLGGNIPDYYAPIGEIGGANFESFLGNVLRDTQDATEGSAIARNVGRAGATTSAVAKAVGDTSAQYRWADNVRALEGRSKFLGFGGDAVTGVRSASLTNQEQKNNYSIRKALAEYGIASDVNSGQADIDSQAGSFMDNLLGGAGDLFGNFMDGGYDNSKMNPENIEDYVSGKRPKLGSADGTDWTKLLLDMAKTFGPMMVGA